MPGLQASSYTAVQSFRMHVKARLAVASSLEEAAQSATELIATHFSDDVLLARIFVTLPYEHLNSERKQFVDKLLESKEAIKQLRRTTPILTLFGTSGREADWNSPSTSRGHQAIPLLSRAFVEEIPMIAHLLKELGVSMEWLEARASGLQVRTIAQISGLCYVSEASEVRDARGRKVISGQEFVARYGVRTVFGVGSTFSEGDSLATMIVFCDKAIERLVAERFMLFISEFASATSALLSAGKLFENKVPTSKSSAVLQ